jgi:transcriptional regulator NrdR family protein
MSANGDKFSCPACGQRTSRVHGSRGLSGPDQDERGRQLYRRLRRCVACGQRYTTIELVERVLRTRKSSAA